MRRNSPLTRANIPSKKQGMSKEEIIEDLNSAIACAIQRGNAITALSGYQAFLFQYYFICSYLLVIINCCNIN